MFERWCSYALGRYSTAPSHHQRPTEIAYLKDLAYKKQKSSTPNKESSLLTEPYNSALHTKGAGRGEEAALEGRVLR